MMGRYYQKVKSYTRKVRDYDDDEDDDSSDDIDCFDVKTDNLEIGW
jgi:hypothetical protein